MALEEEGVARRVVLSHPADLSPHASRRVRQSYYRTYLGRVKDSAVEGEVWEEFTDIGCCGSGTDVPLRVESVEGGPRIDEGTEFEFVERAAEGLESAWAAQYDEPDTV